MDISDHSGRALTSADHRDAVAAQTARFVTVVKGADLATPVPSCPGWSLADLVRHTGSVQRWFAVLLRQRVQERPQSRDVELRLPENEDGYADWLTASAAEAASAFAATDPDALMWVWGADHHARFWVRRMLFETLMHRVDAELAVGIRPEIDRDLAADGVDEFLVNLPFATFFAPKVANLRGNGETIRFRCTDGNGNGNRNGNGNGNRNANGNGNVNVNGSSNGDWLVRLRPDGFGIEQHPAGAATATAADATVEGAAADLLLLLYGRLDRGSDAFETLGDEDLLTNWFANSEF
ncbi:maleylpyruvate isomerase family mycothiol-dependent enzyme [Streptomyces sp. H10-C2]|uniref:maleylpyruvate isomerase family mycothiol-dependent enzyme n=1 Tax=unclassified Streptomyces TaxID=2593676 RepID=UPI0024BB09C7|nr:MULTISPECIES: maleylpyruvate isomerase family mycothiol-dependent enzyme [unclassified Streptomyces]MDJ0343423.1 maleylpyruvate isomerase family mycothiol-dependent enzyme [Streptomyces sp. PH10-H1]MDJ0371503.1 maleylpyruvate isomerase family mycothiol-dependent enzyme [Streptomyces sp. H10-C2]